MKLVLQVAAGVLLALLLYEGVRRYQLNRDLEDATVALAKLSGNLTLPVPRSAAPVASVQMQNAAHVIVDAGDQVARDTKWRAENQAAMQRWKDQQREQALRLKPGEECLGGFQGRPGTIVVRSVANGVPQAVQLLEYGRPVECVGGHRLK